MRVRLIVLLMLLFGAGPATAAAGATIHLPGELFRDCPDCPELVVVPAGPFEMGGADVPLEKPVHRVVLPKPFAIGRREVTFAEWDLCVAAGGCKNNPGDQGWGRGERPAINISWDDAQEYVGWLGRKTGEHYRLPTEAEWEYAARAGTVTAYWWGRDVGVGRATCDGCDGPGHPRQTSPAGSFRPNAFGLFDTAGNAAEWVQDCWNDSFRGAPRDGSAWTAGDCGLRVVRGGGFGSKVAAIRSSARFRYDEDVRYYANGLRVVRELP